MLFKILLNWWPVTDEEWELLNYPKKVKKTFKKIYN